MRIDLRIPPCAPLWEVAGFAKLCEEAGFNGIGIMDSQLLERDVFLSMAAVAQVTSKIKIAPAVLNPITRHPSVIASAIQTVNELAPGRIDLWVGRGFSSVQTIGMSPATVSEMRNCLVTIKGLLAGERVDFGSTVSRLRYADKWRPRIFIAARGPRAIRMAGAVADGVLLQVGLHPASIAMAMDFLAKGAKDAGRNIDELEIILPAATIIHDNQHEAQEMARALCVQRLIDKSYQPYLEAAGIHASHLNIPEELSELYPDVIHAEDGDKARKLCTFLPEEILAEICEAMGLFGTPGYCAAKLAKLETEGIGHVYVMTSETYEFPHRELDAFRDSILPNFA